ncbi:hypothetical protein, partial [Bacteroides heparinolyticus]|uniref:hypothetical protein n=1 Tax=Prevotella heparinolytica TaxID=28113 RepID=UPI0035A031A5
ETVSFAEDWGCILSGRYFLNAPVYSGRAEESFYAHLPSSPTCLTAASLCRDRGKCPIRQTLVFDVTDTSV